MEELIEKAGHLSVGREEAEEERAEIILSDEEE